MAKPRLERGARITLLGLLCNAGLAAGKIAAGIYGHSQALVADGIESTADLVSSLIVWRGLTLAAAPPDERHPYGHGKAEPLAAAVVATLLLFASLWIVVQGVQDSARPQTSPAPFTLLVLIGVVLIKEWLFRRVIREGLQLDSAAVRADAWHHRSDAITSLFAFVGIAVALMGGPAFAAADDYAAILAGIAIGFSGWRLLRPALDELMDIAPDASLAAEISTIAARLPGVVRIEKCLMRKMGRQYLVDMHLEVHPEMTVREAHRIAHQVKDAIRANKPEVRDVLVHVEPEDSLDSTV